MPIEAELEQFALVTAVRDGLLELLDQIAIFVEAVRPWEITIKTCKPFCELEDIERAGALASIEAMRSASANCGNFKIAAGNLARQLPRTMAQIDFVEEELTRILEVGYTFTGIAHLPATPLRVNNNHVARILAFRSQEALAPSPEEE
jgi:hypothetical protein